MLTRKQTNQLCQVAKSLELNDGDVRECLAKYNESPLNADELRFKLKDVHPEILTRDLDNRDGKKEKKLLKRHNRIISSLSSLQDVEQYLSHARTQLNNMEQELLQKLDTSDFKLKSRLKEPESIWNNIAHGNSYTLTDCLGMRLVPADNKDFARLLAQLEANLEQKNSFKLNILSYTREEAIAKISPSSVNYKAIHYYTFSGPHSAEIQIRGRYTDIWAELNHATVYKPKVKTDESFAATMQLFGDICNAVDFREFLG